MVPWVGRSVSISPASFRLSRMTRHGLPLVISRQWVRSSSRPAFSGAGPFSRRERTRRASASYIGAMESQPRRFTSAVPPEQLSRRATSRANSVLPTLPIPCSAQTTAVRAPITPCCGAAARRTWSINSLRSTKWAARGRVGRTVWDWRCTAGGPCSLPRRVPGYGFGMRGAPSICRFLGHSQLPTVAAAPTNVTTLNRTCHQCSPTKLASTATATLPILTGLTVHSY